MSKESLHQLLRVSRRSIATAPTARNYPTTHITAWCQSKRQRNRVLPQYVVSPERRDFSSVLMTDTNVKGDDNHIGHSSYNPEQNVISELSSVNKHCQTCTCENSSGKKKINGDASSHDTADATTASRFPCGSNHHEDELDTLPDPLPEPQYSVHKRVLPKSLTAFASPEGKKMLMEALFVDGTAESYWNLTQHFVNQGDPAFCGVTTLLMCLNALCVDPNIRWRGGWRYYGSEEVLLNRCCLSTERIKRSGITLEDFCQLGTCQGLRIVLKRPNPTHVCDNTNGGYSLDDFREDVQRVLSDKIHRTLLVVSFSRQTLGQTGDGHFSTIAAYYKGTDKVLVLDVARFKYAPYWVSVQDLYQSMQELDSVTKKPRGWCLLYPPKNHACQHVTKEDRRPVEVVPLVGEKDICPIGDIRKKYCKSNLDDDWNQDRR
ncbi:phytochelatin synthase [Nitzschia inconspicua]|uniref:glutathione gamma-glutamylcysteinyltransferase n=1 Tax=Nitzschia inconspicua TaxID=303405 RepID=A0A9K3PY61_9STRA|nr:phytochelatin synthase [Nitzschia inconspicua]